MLVVCNFPSCILLQLIPLEDFSLWHRTVIHIVVVFSFLYFDILELWNTSLCRNLHAMNSLIDRSLPAAEVIEALVLEAELNTTLIANQLTHFILVVSALIKIRIICDACTMTDSLDHIVCRISMCAIALRSPSLIGSLSIIQEDLGIADIHRIGASCSMMPPCGFLAFGSGLQSSRRSFFI